MATLQCFSTFKKIQLQCFLHLGFGEMIWTVQLLKHFKYKFTKTLCDTLPQT